MTDNQTLISALRILARDIQSDDGVPNACIAEAADRIERLDTLTTSENRERQLGCTDVVMRRFFEGNSVATAYLVVICDKETNAIKAATIWSSPEWEQSRCLPDPTFIAYQVRGQNYAVARERLLRAINEPRSRYNWLVKHLEQSA